MSIIRILTLAPLGVILLFFTFANRESVTIQFDPTGYTGLHPVLAPIYAAIISAMAVGVIAGSFSTWLSLGAHRRALSAAHAEIARLRAELETARLASEVSLSGMH